MSETDAKAGPPPVMRVVRTRESLDDAYASLPVPSVRSARAARAAVFTMGALHEGHIALIRAARGEVGPTGHVTVTVFVNPLQFGAGEDLERYPRTLKADLEVCAAEDVDLVFAPAADVLYPTGRPGGAHRPGAAGLDPRGGRAPRALRRRAHRGHEAAAHDPPGCHVLRREGLPAADPGAPHGRRPRPAGEGARRPHGPRGRRAGPLEPQPLPLRRGACARRGCPGRPGRRSHAPPTSAGRPTPSWVPRSSSSCAWG